MRVLLVYPPRRIWPFINEGDNYLLPQSLVCLAAYLRERGVDVKIVDCMPLKIGWRSLANLIKSEKPDVVGVGESHAVYIDEALKLVKLVKEIDDKIITVGGGGHFTNLSQEIMASFPYIDFIVRGEGEETFYKLIEAISLKKGFDRINGIVYREGDKIIINPPASLIEDLDSLPLPAYDMVPMELYGKAKYLFSPGGITIHHSRGCTSRCSFCVWWTQMAERKNLDGKEVLFPRWRTKSVGKIMEEIEILYKKYNKRCLIFVDDSWNIDPKWNEEFADELIRRKFKLNWFAFMRIDCILRDEELGIFEKLVRAGLSHISIGIERVEDEELMKMKKPFYKREITERCIKLIRKKYPQVFIQGTFIVGTRGETKDSLWAQFKFAKKLKIDYPAFHPLTPVPGTEIYEIYKKNNWLEITDFSYYDWMTPVASSLYMKREEIEDEIVKMNLKYVRVPWLLRGLLSPHTYKRRMYMWWLLTSLKVLWETTKARLNPLHWENIAGLKKPEWYMD